MNKMKAASLFAVGDLRYIDMEVPNCKDDEVLVKIKNYTSEQFPKKHKESI